MGFVYCENVAPDRSDDIISDVRLEVDPLPIRGSIPRRN